MQNLSRITFDPQVMGGKPCIRGMRVTVGALVGLHVHALGTMVILFSMNAFDLPRPLCRRLA